ncbi:MAG: PLDc N-terminal domain-containing protein [Acidobacteriaceae bacterium]
MAGPNTTSGIPSGALTAAIGLGIGLVAGTFLAFWLLCLGYVYADSRRRAMPAVLWVLVAIFVPNLLGFLLYFAIRHPLGSPCSNCGQLIAAEQRFCSWCGRQSFAPPPAPSSFQSPGSGPGPATV